MNLMDLDFENTVDKVTVTGGKDGCIAQIFYKDGRVDAHAFVKPSANINAIHG